jgi:hypothetical protein
LAGEAEWQKPANFVLFDSLVMLSCKTEYCIEASIEVQLKKLSNNINNIIIKQDKSGIGEICAWFCKKYTFTVGKMGARLID